MPNTRPTDKEARTKAWNLVEANFPHMTDDQEKSIQAAKYLYKLESSTVNLDSISTLDNKSKLTKKRFIEGHFIIRPSIENQYILASSKSWNTQATFQNIPVVYASLYPLYQAALDEITSQPQTQITLEAVKTLEECFKLENLKVPEYIEQRKKRIAALMLQNAQTEFPAMSIFWQKYEEIYRSNAPTHFPSTAFAQSEKYNIETVSLEQLKLIAEAPAVINSTDPLAAIEQNVEHKKSQVAMQMVIHDFETTVTATDESEHKLQIIEFLKNRKNTDKERGYTSNPSAPENLFCAQLAKSFIDPLKPNPRQQFWLLLYPNLTGIYLGDNDNDWPEYGEALLSDSHPHLLINYRKLALMSQHHDVRAVIMGEEIPLDISDKILIEFLRGHPNYVNLSEADRNHIKSFNSVDAKLWITPYLGIQIKKILRKEIPNFLVFFRELLEVYTQYGYLATPGIGRRTGDKPEYDFPKAGSPAVGIMLKALSPYLQVFSLPMFKQKLEQIRDEFTANSLHFNSMRYLATKDSLEIIGTCWNQQYNDTAAIVGDPKHPLSYKQTGQQEIIKKLESVVLTSAEFSVWSGVIANHHDPRPAIIQDDIYKDIIKQITIPIELLELHLRVNNIPDNVLAQKFMELTDPLPLEDLWNVVAAKWPRAEFVQLLFPDGIPKARLNDTNDCLWALKFYERYPNLPGIALLAERTLSILRARSDLKVYQASILKNSELAKIIPLIQLLIEHYYVKDCNAIAFLSDIALPTNTVHMAEFLNNFTGNGFQRVLQLFATQLKFTVSNISSLTSIFYSFQSDEDASRQKALIDFFFNILEKCFPHEMSFIARLEPEASAHLIVKLTQKITPTITPTDRLTYIANLLSLITDTDKLAIVLLILLHKSSENPDLLDIRLNTLTSTQDRFGGLLKRLTKQQARVFCDIIAPTASDMIMVLKSNPAHLLYILDEMYDLTAIILTIDDYIGLFNVVTDKNQLSNAKFKFDRIFKLIKTPDDFIKAAQAFPREFLNQIIGGNLINAFTQNMQDIVKIVNKLSDEQLNDFFTLFPARQWTHIYKSILVLKNLNDAAFTKVMQNLQIPVITKDNIDYYFPAEMPATTENLVRLLTAITIEDHENICKAVIGIFNIDGLPKTQETLRNLAVLPDDKLNLVLIAMKLIPQIAKDVNELKLIYSDLNVFVTTFSTIHDKEDEQRLIAFADFSTFLKTFDDWSVLLCAFSIELYPQVLKLYPMPPLKTVDELCTLLDEMIEMQCKAILEHIQLSINNIDDWVKIFQKLPPTLADAVAKKFKFTDQFANNILPNVFFTKFHLLATSLNAAQFSAIVDKLHISIQTVGIDNFSNLINWTPLGDEEEEIGKLSNLTFMPGFNPKLVSQFSDNQVRQRQLIMAMFSSSYLVEKTGLGTYEKIDFKTFEKYFNNLVVSGNIQNTVATHWKDLALTKVLKEQIKKPFDLNLFIGNLKGEQLRKVLKIAQTQQIAISGLWGMPCMDSTENVSILLEVMDAEPRLNDRDSYKVRAAIVRQYAKVPPNTITTAIAKTLLVTYIAVENHINVALVLKNAYLNKHNVEHHATAAQFAAFNNVFERYLFCAGAQKEEDECIKHYFQQLPFDVQISQMLIGLNAIHYETMIPEYKNILIKGLNNPQLFTRALSQLMPGNQLNAQALQELSLIVRPYLDASSFSTSHESITMAKLINAFIGSKSSLLAEDKIMLYVLMTPYMTNEEYNTSLGGWGSTRTLFNRLQPFYNRLKADIGFDPVKDNYSAAYTLCVTVKGRDLATQAAAYVTLFNTRQSTDVTLITSQSRQANQTNSTSTTSTIPKNTRQ